MAPAYRVNDPVSVQSLPNVWIPGVVVGLTYDTRRTCVVYQVEIIVTGDSPRPGQRINFVTRDMRRRE
ncbi:hypothetical protein C8Q78DRAFT_1030784 [Trametes maxima]|nr:hypothetical protein C8Q78DRAFT_1030784 [Trametes maxima]